MNAVQLVHSGINCADGHRLAVRIWRTARPVGIVVLAHGLGEHANRYPLVIDALTSNDFSVVAYDQPGHGASTGSRHRIDHFDSLVAAFAEVIERAAVEPDLPVFALGHSMGGLVVARYLETRKHSLAGAIISSGAFSFPRFYPAPVESLLQRIADRLPWLPLPNAPPPAHPRDPFGRTGYLPLITGREVVLNGGIALQHAGAISLPLLVMAGADDELTLPEGAQLLVERCASFDKSLIYWPGRDHNLLNNPDDVQPIASICNWLLDRVPVHAHPATRAVSVPSAKLSSR